MEKLKAEGSKMKGERIKGQKGSVELRDLGIGININSSELKAEAER